MKMLQNLFAINKIELNKNFTQIKITFLGFKITFKIKNRIKTIENCIAIIDCGGIGDYMLCRPYFRYLKECPKFKNSNFIYLCKNAYQDMVKTYDKNIFYDVIVYDENLKTVKNNLKKYKIHTLINLFSLSRGNFFKGWNIRYNLIKNLNIKNKIADVTIDNEEDLKNKNLKIYSKLIITKTKSFELERRRQFFEKLTQMPIPIINKEITPVIDLKKEYISISLFTAYKKRNYNSNKWVKVLNYLLDNLPQNIQLLFLGGNNDKDNIQKILNQLKESSRCINFAGVTSISLIPSILNISKFLISLETGTVHIAESVNCPTICISCGSHWGRFLPYNKSNISYIFPDEFEILLAEKNNKKLEEFYQANWSYKVEDIPSEKIIKEIDKFLKIYCPQTLVAVERE